jgi:hypothetical protein
MSTRDDALEVSANSDRDPTIFKILRWLAEDRTRTLPHPDDSAAIQELAEAVGKSPEYICELMVWNFGDRPEGYTPELLI